MVLENWRTKANAVSPQVNRSDRHAYYSGGDRIAMDLKLCIELVPKTCWKKNLRTQMKRSRWDKLRKKVHADQGNACCVCGAGGKFFCHEIWDYDDEQHVQKLRGFLAICTLCNAVIHFGVALEIAGASGLSPDSVIEHFMRVNGVERDVFVAHAAEAYAVWQRRSSHEWQIDFGEWAALVE
jgi:hypothetical protein